MEDVANAMAMSQNVMEQMRKLEISKKYDEEKLLKLRTMPPRDVNAFMTKESKKTEEEKMTDDDRRVKRFREEKKEKAARTIQKYFRKIKVRTEKRKFKNRITKIGTKRRLVLLEQIRMKMAEQQSLRHFSGYQVVRSVELHKARQQMHSDWFPKLSVDVSFHDMNLSRPNSPTHPLARAIPALIRKKAEMKHEQQMKKIDDGLMDFICGLQKDPQEPNEHQ